MKKPTTFHVSNSEDILDALRGAKPGDIIIIHAGTYNIGQGTMEIKEED